MNKFWQLRIKRNSSYFGSLDAMFRNGLWDAPYALFSMTAESIWKTVYSAICIVLCTFLFLVGLVSIIVAGLTGFLTSVSPEEQQAKETP